SILEFVPVKKTAGNWINFGRNSTGYMSVLRGQLLSEGLHPVPRIPNSPASDSLAHLEAGVLRLTTQEICAAFFGCQRLVRWCKRLSVDVGNIRVHKRVRQNATSAWQNHTD
ncbi:MAG: hypothetical protein ACYDHM_13695, partial [Acidiferrobacterales bacterium]